MIDRWLVGASDSSDPFGSVKDFFNSSTWHFLTLMTIFFLVVLWLACAYWVFKDARRRIDDKIVITVAVLTGLIFGPRLTAPGQRAHTSDRIVPGSWEKLRQDFAAHPPAFIVDTEVGENAQYPIDQFPMLSQMVAARYEPVAHTAEGMIYALGRRQGPADRRAILLDRR